MNQSNPSAVKPHPKRYRLYYIIAAAVAIFSFSLYIAIRLAMRDAEDGVDFAFKVFSAFAAFVFAFFGPIGMIGLLFMWGQARRLRFGVTITFGVIATIVIVAYVLNRFNAFMFLPF